MNADIGRQICYDIYADNSYCLAKTGLPLELLNMFLNQLKHKRATTKNIISTNWDLKKALYVSLDYAAKNFTDQSLISLQRMN